MRIYAETPRLILREILESDIDNFYELDSDPEVHKFLGNNPISSKEQVIPIIESVRQQYAEYGIGRWAIIEKSSGEFVGWSGLKYITEEINKHSNFHDVGYRLVRKHWNKGFATESAMAAIEYGFTKMKLEEIIGIAHEENVNSQNALQKCGLEYIENFETRGLQCTWNKITRQQWIHYHQETL